MARSIKSYLGKVIRKAKVVSMVPREIGKPVCWNMLCLRCGKEFTAPSSYLRLEKNGHEASCDGQPIKKIHNIKLPESVVPVDPTPTFKIRKKLTDKEKGYQAAYLYSQFRDNIREQESTGYSIQIQPLDSF